MIWSEEATNLLITLWQSGNSAGKCAVALGITKNAAIGRAHRIGLNRKRDPDAPKPIRIRKERKAISMPKPPRPLPEPEDCTDGVPMELLQNFACRYPLNSGVPEYLFCGRVKNEHSSYCFDHERVCVNIQARRTA